MESTCRCWYRQTRASFARKVNRWQSSLITRSAAHSSMARATSQQATRSVLSRTKFFLVVEPMENVHFSVPSAFFFFGQHLFSDDRSDQFNDEEKSEEKSIDWSTGNRGGAAFVHPFKNGNRNLWRKSNLIESKWRTDVFADQNDSIFSRRVKHARRD